MDKLNKPKLFLLNPSLMDEKEEIFKYLRNTRYKISSCTKCGNYINYTNNNNLNIIYNKSVLCKCYGKDEIIKKNIKEHSYSIYNINTHICNIQ
jgi:hypothetical protein